MSRRGVAIGNTVKAVKFSERAADFARKSGRGPRTPRRFACAVRRSRHYPCPVRALQSATVKNSDGSTSAKILTGGAEIPHLVVVLLPTHPLDRLRPSLEERCDEVPTV